MKPALIAILALVTACLMCVARLFLSHVENCPEGYEDEHGFHFGR